MFGFCILVLWSFVTSCGLALICKFCKVENYLPTTLVRTAGQCYKKEDC